MNALEMFYPATPASQPQPMQQRLQPPSAERVREQLGWRLLPHNGRLDR